MPPPTSTPSAPVQGHVACRTVVDQGNPVAVLHDKGVMETNKSDPQVLVNALRLFKDLKASYLAQTTCNQIITITQFLEEAMLHSGRQ